MNERITEMIMEFAEIAEEYSYVEYAKKQTGYSRQYFYNQKFAELIYKDIITVVAAQALSNHSALDVFKNLRWIYEGIEE